MYGLDEKVGSKACSRMKGRDWRAGSNINGWRRAGHKARTGRARLDRRGRAGVGVGQQSRIGYSRAWATRSSHSLGWAESGLRQDGARVEPGLSQG